MAKELPWDDCKVCFGIESDKPFDRMPDGRDRAELPTGWKVCETDCTGARVVVIFRVSVLPTETDAYKVKAWLRRIGAMRKT